MLSISTAICSAKLLFPPILSCAIAWQLRRGEGRVEWVDVAAGGKQGRHLAQMTDVE